MGDIVTSAEDGITKLYRDLIFGGDTSKEMTIAHMGIYAYLHQLNDRVRHAKAEKVKVEKAMQ
jgi:hypothetical protein